jgi:hypothetical protein
MAKYILEHYAREENRKGFGNTGQGSSREEFLSNSVLAST